MTVLPEQLARLFFSPIGRERLQNKRASSPVDILDNHKLPNASITQSLLDCFFSCTGTLFYIFSAEEARDLYQAVYMDPEGATKAALGALCAMACVACQYDDANIDGSLRRSYYKTAKFYLDECIEEDEVLGMKVLCCLAIYCVMDQRLTAWTWIMTGLKLARLRGIHREGRPVSLKPEVWIGQRKVLRTLVFLASWLSSTLGNNPEITLALQPAVDESFSVLEEHPSIESLAQQQFTNISVITTGVLQDVFFQEDLSLVKTRGYKLKMAEWLHNLPAIMQLDSLISNETLTEVQRRSIFLVHLNYLGALLLLYRRHLFHLGTIRRDDPWQLDGDIDEALEYAEDAVDAATQSAQILGLLLSERTIFRRCWLAIYQSFSSCTVLLFHVAQKRLHGAPRAEYDDELSKAKTCLAILDYCAQGDTVAKGYHDMLIVYYNALQTAQPAKHSLVHPLGNTIGVSHSSANSIIETGTQAPVERVADAVGNILAHPYQYGAWLADSQETDVPSFHTSQLAPQHIFKDGVVGRVEPSGTAGVYANSPVFGGPFQWSATPSSTSSWGA